MLAATTDVDTSGIGAVAEHHWQGFVTRGALSGNIAAAGRIDSDGDGWVGIGIAGRYQFSNGFFLEGSFMPGLYRRGDTDLGGSLQFRSLIGAGFNVGKDLSLSVTIDHLSNGGTQSINPGSEAIMLRITFR